MPDPSAGPGVAVTAPCTTAAPSLTTPPGHWRLRWPCWSPRGGSAGWGRPTRHPIRVRASSWSTLAGPPRWRAWSTRTATSPCPAGPTGSTGPPTRPRRLLAVAEHNARLLHQAGVRWARDVGQRRSGDGRALSLTVRDRWRRSRRVPVCPRGRLPGWPSTGSLPAGLPRRSRRRRRPAGRRARPARRRRRPGEALPGRARPRHLPLHRQRGPRRRWRRCTPAAPRSPRTPGCCPAPGSAAAAGVDSLEHGFQLDADARPCDGRAGHRRW